MNASLPEPQDVHPHQPDGDLGGARAQRAPVTPLPPKPKTPAVVAAGQEPTPAPRAKKPRKTEPRKKPTVAPGPAPPLPRNLNIPPKPPVPPTVMSPRAEVPQAIEAPAAVEVLAVAEASRVVEVTPIPEPAPTVRPQPAPAVVEPAPRSLPEALIATSVLTGSAALEVKSVTKAFGDTRAVDGIDLTVPSGTFYGLVGPNGAGKTTTLSMIAGLLRPDRGSFRVNGVDAASDPIGAKRQMGVLPDRLRTFDRLTGRQLLHYYGVLRGLPSAVVESRATDLARAFDLSDALGRLVSDYSAGMAKKVMLAGAMIHSPRLLVLDEPFESVDPVSSAIILDILSAYVAHGGTVILSSHGMELVERVCSRVAVIVAGQVLAEGTVDEVRGELTLEQRFIELAGGLSDVEGLEWLHTFSD